MFEAIIGLWDRPIGVFWIIQAGKNSSWLENGREKIGLQKIGILFDVNSLFGSERLMAKNLIRYRLDDNTEAVFETEDISDGSEELMSRGERDENEIPEAKQPFRAVVQQIRPVAETVLGALEGFNRPQEINLEFGVKLGGKAGIVFASAESECNFKIGLKWTNPKAGG